MYCFDAEGITRIEIINHSSCRKGVLEQFGRIVITSQFDGVGATISIQDEGRTLKVFLNDLEKEQTS